MTWLLLALVFAQADEASASTWTQAQWEAWIEKTDKEMNRLSPRDFPGLPSEIQHDLIERKCTIPQVGVNSRPHNVVNGHFQLPSRLDWAVLCSIDRTSRILIYPGGNVEDLQELPASARPDRDWFQTGTGFSRALASADAKHIVRHYKEYGGPEPPQIDHDGLEEIFVEKASTIHYWHAGSWLMLQGAD